MGKISDEHTVISVYVPKKLKALLERHSKDKNLSKFIRKAMQDRMVKKGWVKAELFED